MRIVGPFKDTPSTAESIYRKFHRLFSRKLHAKFSNAYLKRCAREVENAIEKFQPDVIFSHNLIPLVYLDTDVPIVYKTDAVLWNMHAQWPTYSRVELARMLVWERKVLGKVTRIITASRWAESALVQHYHIPPENILILPIPSSLPMELIPKTVVTKTISKKEVRLLAVAKDYHLKGIDIAVETTQKLLGMGIKTHLRVVGQEGQNSELVKYMGLYQKKDPRQMQAYLEQYQWAHFLIHPARYEAAGIVCGEAAAFGVPTITNGIGGLATTVEDGVSGVVLPRLSPAQAYIDAITYYVDHPQEYQTLSRKTRQRYLNELNWQSAGIKIMDMIHQATGEKRTEGAK